jgi:hypothetical protein
MKNINLLLLTLPLLAIFASCLSRQYPVTSTYEETAYRTEYVSETYTENETAVETLSGQYELSPLYAWYSPYITFSGNTNFWYTAYDIPQSPPYDNIRLKVSIWKQPQIEPAKISVLDMTRSGQLFEPLDRPYGYPALPTVIDMMRGGHLSAPAAPVEEDSSTIARTWITGTSSGGSSDSSSGGVSNAWLDAANIQINQALFLGGRSYPTFSALLPKSALDGRVTGSTGNTLYATGSLYLGGRTYVWPEKENPLTFELNAGKAQKIGTIICGPLNSWNAKAYITATWSRTTTSYHPVTKERKIEKQAPYTVQKQKTIYETRQAPFWEAVRSP